MQIFHPSRWSLCSISTTYFLSYPSLSLHHFFLGPGSGTGNLSLGLLHIILIVLPVTVSNTKFWAYQLLLNSSVPSSPYEMRTLGIRVPSGITSFPITPIILLEIAVLASNVQTCHLFQTRSLHRPFLGPECAPLPMGLSNPQSSLSAPKSLLGHLPSLLQGRSVELISSGTYLR